jgi:hypothetical protein
MLLMIPIPIPLQLLNNQDWNQQLQLNSYNPSTNIRTPFDLTGCELKMTLIGENSGMSSLTLDSNTSGMLVVGTDPTTGQAMIQVPALTMWTMEAGYYTSDLLIFQPTGAVINAQSFEIEMQAGDTAPTP